MLFTRGSSPAPRRDNLWGPSLLGPRRSHSASSANSSEIAASTTLGTACAARLVVDALRHRLDVPDQAECRHRLDHIPGDVELPPVEAVARRALEAVVVVVDRKS